jgi:hypothetical protein
MIEEYFPASHREQALAPKSEYIPAAQSLQAVELLAAASLENLPAAQLAHDVALPGE